MMIFKERNPLSKMEYTPEQHKKIVDDLRKAEIKYETAQLECEYHEAKNKAFLAEIEVNLIDTQSCPIGKAKSVALASKEWSEKVEEYYKKLRWNVVKAQCEFHGLKRDLEHVDRGMSYNQTLIKNRILDGGK